MEFIYRSEDGRSVARLNGLGDANLVLESFQDTRNQSDGLMKRLRVIVSRASEGENIPDGLFEVVGRDAVDALALFLREADSRGIPVEHDRSLGRISVNLAASIEAPVELDNARIARSRDDQAGVNRFTQEPSSNQLTLDMEELPAVAAS